MIGRTQRGATQMYGPLDPRTVKVSELLDLEIVKAMKGGSKA